MGPITLQSLQAYWSTPVVAVNVAIFANLLGALLLGFVVGYERTYHGRAAGMRTYGLVCMASAALTVVSGYAEFWYGGAAHHSEAVTTQVIQGIVTGIGFLGAGVILKEGLNISGLTTAASIWSSSAIGVLVGVGFYAAAILLTLLSAGCMMYASRMEMALPARPAVVVNLRFRPDFAPTIDLVRVEAAMCGYEIALGTLNIVETVDQREWRFVLVGLSRESMSPLPQLAESLRQVEGIVGLQVAASRN